MSFVWSVVTFFALNDLAPDQRSHVKNLFTWLPSGGLQVKMGFLVDPLSVTFILFVTGVATLIHVFAIGYMHGDSRFTRFFAYMNLFVASMLILVLGSSFLVTFLGWEGVGLCSYLLISFWFERRAAAVAGKKAFITTRVGDFGFMVAMFLIFEKLGHARLLGARARRARSRTEPPPPSRSCCSSARSGKSAQFPLHVWLPDAMEGPTPVSALIHAATMVTAGVFLVARAHPFFEASGDAMTVVAWIGGITALLAATVALVQPDIKRVLAYSTISQLGYMFLALGVGAYGAAIFHVVTHAFFKGTLFLGAGSVIHGNADNQDMRIMGRFRKYMPYTSMAFIVAWLAIAGVPPFAGFWSKDEILTKAFFDHDYGVWALGHRRRAAHRLLHDAARCTWCSSATTRFRATPACRGRTGRVGRLRRRSSSTTPIPPPGRDDVGLREQRTDGLVRRTAARSASSATTCRTSRRRSMTGPLLVLASLAAIGGMLVDPAQGASSSSSTWLEPVFRDVPAIETAVVRRRPDPVGRVGHRRADRDRGSRSVLYRRGIAATRSRIPASSALGRVGPIFGHAYYFDEGIAAPGRRPGAALRRVARDVFDAGIIDGAVNGVASLVARGGESLRRVQTGLVRNYALWIVVGAVGLLLYLVIWAGR